MDTLEDGELGVVVGAETSKAFQVGVFVRRTTIDWLQAVQLEDERGVVVGSYRRVRAI